MDTRALGHIHDGHLAIGSNWGGFLLLLPPRDMYFFFSRGALFVRKKCYCVIQLDSYCKRRDKR